MKNNEKNDGSARRAFRILRFFSIASFISICVTATLLTLFYRQVAIQTITELGEESNLVLAQTALNSVQDELVDFLISMDEMSQGEILERRIGGQLGRAVQKLMHDTWVARIKIYNRDGVVVFSTRPGQIGRDQSSNRGFQAAINGQVASKLIYRDAFNRFDKETEEDNLIQSYIPVRKTPAGPLYGVFEIYTDINRLVVRAEHAQLVIATGVVMILMLLYAVLVIIVRRAERVIERQQGVIEERTRTLELLSAQLLTAQEDEKKRIAGDLHEGIAQTLGAIKFQVENAQRHMDSDPHGAGAKALESLVPVIQEAIQQVRTMAVGLRPSSLDDFGVVATITGLCRELRSIYPELRVQAEIQVREDDVPGSLKVIIFRIIHDALSELGKHGRANLVHIGLRRIDGSIVLELKDGVFMDDQATSDADDGDARTFDLAAMKERTVLSGGVFSVGRNQRGGLVGRSCWSR